MSNHETSLNRRNFLQSSVTAGAGLTIAAVPNIARAEDAPRKPLPSKSVLLFQGDSITDAGRDRMALGPNNVGGLGNGYPFLLACDLLRDHAASDLNILNRGISGNKVPDLQARWQQDCVELKPNVLSILIGVNDLWHRLNGNYTGTKEEYETGYRALLKGTREKLPQTRLVICEPFVLRCGSINDKWFPEFNERRASARKLAEEFGASFVPFQSMFDQATKTAPPEYWARDGVHPSLAGHALMAKTWREVCQI